MGMDAELLAVGKYALGVRGSLSYPADFYDDTPVGTTIITSVGVCVTTDQSEKLATAFGISPWQFQEHCDLSGEGVNLDLLAKAFESGYGGVAAFLALRTHGFRFYYLPNG